jgi:hypothetical protein
MSDMQKSERAAEQTRIDCRLAYLVEQTMRIHLLAAACLLLFSSLPASAEIGDRRSYVPRLIPSDPSERDTRYIGFYNHCGSAPLQSPVVIRPVPGDPYARLIDLQESDTPDLCFPEPVPFSQTLYLVELPDDPTIERVTIRLRSENGGIQYFDETIETRARVVTPPSIAGTWNSPGNAGQGVHLSFSPVPVSGSNGVAFHDDGLVVVWATYTPEGEQMWLTGAGRLGQPSQTNSGYVTTIPLYSTDGGTFPGRTGAAATAALWGSVDIEYVGCGEVRFSWAAQDAIAFPTGSMDLSQLTHTSASPCNPEVYEHQRARNVEIIVPQVGAAAVASESS